MTEEKKNVSQFVKDQSKKRGVQVAINENGEHISGMDIRVMNNPDDRPKLKRTNEPQFFNMLFDFQTDLFKYYNLTETEAGLLLQLCSFVRFTHEETDRNYIKLGNKNAKNKDIAEILKISYNQWTINYRKKLLDSGILLQDENGFYLHRNFMTRGYQRSNTKSYRVYRKPIQDLYDLFVTKGKPTTAKHLGLFLSIIPYIHKQSNTIVLGEYDEKKKRHVYHNYDSLAKALGKRNEKIKNKPYGTFQQAIMQMNDTYYLATGHHLIYEIKVQVKPSSEVDDRKLEEFRLVLNPKVSFSSTTSQRESLEKLLIEIDLNKDSQASENKASQTIA